MKNPTRNIPLEMANLAIEKGEGISRAELRREGFTDAQIDEYAHEAAILHAQRTTRRVA